MLPVLGYLPHRCSELSTVLSLPDSPPSRFPFFPTSPLADTRIPPGVRSFFSLFFGYFLHAYRTMVHFFHSHQRRRRRLSRQCSWFGLTDLATLAGFLQSALIFSVFNRTISSTPRLPASQYARDHSRLIRTTDYRPSQPPNLPQARRRDSQIPPEHIPGFR